MLTKGKVTIGLETRFSPLCDRGVTEFSLGLFYRFKSVAQVVRAAES